MINALINAMKKLKGQSPIGLDIGHDSVKMIQLADNGANGRVMAAAKRYRARGAKQLNTERLVSMLRDMYVESGFSGKAVVSSLPHASLKLTSLRVSDSNEERLRDSVQPEMYQRFGLDSEYDVIDYLPAGRVSQGQELKQEVVVFAVKDKDIRDHIELLEKAGFEAASIEPSACSLFRCFRRSFKRANDKEQTSVFVDLGSAFTTVVYSRQGEEINFVKQIPIGSRKFDSRVASKLGIDTDEAHLLRTQLQRSAFVGAGTKQLCAVGHRTDGAEMDEGSRRVMTDTIREVAEQLVAEITRCFRYYAVTFRDHLAKRAIFAGGGVYDPILMDVLQRRLAVDIELVHPLSQLDITGVDFDGDKRGCLSEWSVAVGLALKQSGKFVSEEQL